MTIENAQSTRKALTFSKLKKYLDPRQYWVWGAVAAVCVAALIASLVAAYPDRDIVIAAGPEGSYFELTAKQYAVALKRAGVNVKIINTAGARENIERINDPKQDIDFAFTHGGVTNAKESPNLISVSSINYDPLWIFYRNKIGVLTKLNQLQGLRIAIGKKGSGMNGLSLRMLGAAGITKANSQIIEMNISDADEALIAGTIDVALIMDPPDTARVQDFFKSPGVVVMDMSEQAEGIQRNLPYLHVLNLPAGTINLQKQIPAQDVKVLATTMTMVAREATHPALVYLLMSEMDKIHEPPSLMHKENTFPSDQDVDLPLSVQSERYFKDGKPFLQRYLPFWLASTVERLIAILIPMAAILIPVFQLIPKAIQWLNKSKLTRCYQKLIELEQRVKLPPNTKEEYATLKTEFDKLLRLVDHYTDNRKISLQYSEQVYVLKEHIASVQAKLGSATA